MLGRPLPTRLAPLRVICALVPSTFCGVQMGRSEFIKHTSSCPCNLSRSQCIWPDRIVSFPGITEKQEAGSEVSSIFLEEIDRYRTCFISLRFERMAASRVRCSHPFCRKFFDLRMNGVQIGEGSERPC